MPFDKSVSRYEAIRQSKLGLSAAAVGRQRIIQGDCLPRLRDLADGTFDLVITSPPYNIGVAYGTYADRRPKKAYLAWLTEVTIELKRVLRDDGSFFLNLAGTSADPWLPMEVAGALRHLFHIQNHIVWVKSISIGNDTMGHFKPIHSSRYLNHSHEALFHLTKSGVSPIDRLAVGVPFKDKSNIARWGHARDRRCAGNVWFIPYETVRSRREKYYHPAGFPLELPKRCMKMHGRQNAAVLDPFLGAGTTLVAAEELGLMGTGIELDEKYVKIARQRLKQTTGL